MKKFVLVIMCVLVFKVSHTQPLQFGIGYGLGYYYKHLTNLEVFAMEYNNSGGSNMEISNFCNGPTLEFVAGRGGSGFLLNWMMRGNTYSAGSDDIRTRITRTGVGFKYARNSFGVGITMDIGRARVQARTGSADWGGLFSTEKDMYIGSTLFADIYAFGRFGLRAYWMHNWIKCEFGSIENFKFNFSNVGIEVSAYLFRNGVDQ